MKRFVLQFVILLSAIGAYAQDVIVMKNGDIIQSKVQEITSTEIKYKKFSNLDGPIYTIEKTTVLSINYENGEKELITSNDVAVKEESTVPAVEIGLPDEESNQTVLNYVNGSDVTYVGEEDKREKKANYFYCKLGALESSQFVNKDIEISMGIKNGDDEVAERMRTNIKAKTSDCRTKLYVRVKNKTDKTIYIDLANTFFKRGEQSSPFYSPQVTSTTNVGSTGASVNLGAVTGGLLNGVNVGGGKSSASTTVTYAQRIIAIAPMSSQDLEPQYIFNFDHQPTYPGFSTKRTFVYYHAKCKRGEEFCWDYNSSPLKCGTYLTYSFDENFSAKSNMNIDLYLAKIIAGSANVWNGKVDLSSNAPLVFKAYLP